MLHLRESIGEELQQLFGVGLQLAGAKRLSTSPELTERLQQAVDDIDGVIRHIRTRLWAADARSPSATSVSLVEHDVAEVDAPAKVLNVLAVEDDEGMQALIREILAGVGTVHVAPDAYQALAWLDNEPVDVMVLDLMLPGVNGVDLLERAKLDGCSVPTVVVTGMTGPGGVAAAATEAGAALILTKPFAPQLLRDAVVDAARSGQAALALH
jgi:CheY-like chemotaxis protein